jgi:hypothetical protein
MMRFVITYARGRYRYLVGPAQARYTCETREVAEAEMDAMLGPNNPNSADSIKQLFGDAPDFKVMEVECWDTGDPKRVIWPNE